MSYPCDYQFNIQSQSNIEEEMEQLQQLDHDQTMMSSPTHVVLGDPSSISSIATHQYTASVGIYLDDFLMNQQQQQQQQTVVQVAPSLMAFLQQCGHLQRKNCFVLKGISIQGERITELPVTTLASMLGDNIMDLQYLQQLALDDLCLSGSLQPLAQVIRGRRDDNNTNAGMSCSLEEIWFSDCTFLEDVTQQQTEMLGLDDLADALSHCHNLREIDLSFCPHDDRHNTTSSSTPTNSSTALAVIPQQQMSLVLATRILLASAAMHHYPQQQQQQHQQQHTPLDLTLYGLVPMTTENSMARRSPVHVGREQPQQYLDANLFDSFCQAVATTSLTMRSLVLTGDSFLTNENIQSIAYHIISSSQHNNNNSSSSSSKLERLDIELDGGTMIDPLLDALQHNNNHLKELQVHVRAVGKFVVSEEALENLLDLLQTQNYALKQLTISSPRGAVDLCWSPKSEQLLASIEFYLTLNREYPEPRKRLLTDESLTANEFWQMLIHTTSLSQRYGFLLTKPSLWLPA